MTTKVCAHEKYQGSKQMMVWYCWSMVLPKWMSLRIASPKMAARKWLNFKVLLENLSKPKSSLSVQHDAAWEQWWGTPMIWNIFLGWGSLKQFSPNFRKDSCFNWGIFFSPSNLRHQFFRWWFLLDGFETPLKNVRQGGIPMDGRLCGNKNSTTGDWQLKDFLEFSPRNPGEKIYLICLEHIF